jgi:biotin carboxyl carrier protein
MKTAAIRLVIVLGLVGLGYGGWKFYKNLPSQKEQFPTTRVRRGDVVMRSFARGELRPVRSATLTAPNLFGTVQVTKLAPLGALARDKDLVVEFDDAELVSRLEQKQLELEQVDEQIKKAQADLAIRNNQDDVELLRARYSVRRAELEVKRNELLSTIDRKKNELNLEEARRKLKQLESDIKSRREQAQAELAVFREKRNRNVLDIRREQMRLAQTKILAPLSGLVAIKQNRSGFSGMFGTAVPDIREGDQVSPGNPVADVMDLSEMEIVARIGEIDRANLVEGQDVMLRLDALPEKVFNGKIKSMSGTASANIFSSDPGKKFDVLFSIDMRQLLKTLGADEAEIVRILRTADENRKKPIASAATSMFAGMPGGFAGMTGAPGGAGGGMTMVQMGGGMAMGGQTGGQEVQSGGQAGGQASGDSGQSGQRMMMGGGAGMTPEQQQQLRAALQKALNGRNMQDLSQGERQKIFAELRKTAGGATKSGDASKKSDTGKSDSGAKQAATTGAPAFGLQRPGGGESFSGAARQGGEGRQRGGFDLAAMGTGTQYTQKELDNAKLPPPPEEDSEVSILLRPGLLADVEIIVEKVPNAIYVPNQSVFEKDGKTVVYVKEKDRFVARQIKIAKRSESVTIISGGVNAGDVISMSDPEAKPGDAKKGGAKKEGGSAAGMMPVGGSKGGQ